MNFIEQWTESFHQVLTDAMNRVALYLPNIVGALLVLMLGWLVARIARMLATRSIMLLDVVLARLVPAGKMRAGDRPSLAGSAQAVGSIVFWVVMLLGIAVSAQ